MNAMMQNLTDDAKAILLLCGRFGKSDRPDGPKPLSLSEYNRLADWMMHKGMRPADLLADAVDDQVPGVVNGIQPERIRKLLARGAAMALAVEKWTHNGIWIVCRSDEAYPVRLKKHLKRSQAPPILFGVGERGLLSLGGLAVVGSRNVDAAGEAFTREVGETCARYEIPILSGGARGVDQVAMLSCLNAGGSVVGVMADGLLKTAVAGKYRQGIREKRLVLFSPYHPEAKFTVGNAMGRNKLIYAMADFALVVNAEKEKGGTWAGAKEELKRPEPKPVFVRMDGNVPEGNRALIELGARPFPKKPWNDHLKGLLENAPPAEGKRMHNQRSLFGETAGERTQDVSVRERWEGFGGEPDAGTKPKQKEFLKGNRSPGSVYEAVLPLMLAALGDWKTPKQLAVEIEVRKVQLDDWLKRAVEEGSVKKKSRPVRFRRN